MTGLRTFTFLGTGTSVGIPMVGCRCEVCRSDNPRNKRYRCSVLISTPAGNILIDTTPELRLQLVREQVDRIDAVLYTHHHADHLFGLDDLRPFPVYTGQPVPIYCTDVVEARIRESFNYAFPADEHTSVGYVPKLVFERITADPFVVLGQWVTPIPLEHAGLTVFGFRIGDVAYCTDVSRIPESSWPLLEGLLVLILDALRYKPHVAHFSLNEAMEVVARVRPQQAYFTHMSHDIDHDTVSGQLPAGIALAYDGLKFSF
jgi:phosphoribosyl 1,2-cyclic phosphate phosphodiesterase